MSEIKLWIFIMATLFFALIFPYRGEKRMPIYKKLHDSIIFKEKKE